MRVVRIVDGAEPLANVDALEPPALLKARGHLGDERIGGRLAGDFAGDRQHVGIGRGVVAVDSDFGNDARRGLCRSCRCGSENDNARQQRTPHASFDHLS